MSRENVIVKTKELIPISGHVLIQFFNPNYSCKNILKYGTPYAEHNIQQLVKCSTLLHKILFVQNTSSNT
jgi:hypothetical protein